MSLKLSCESSSIEVIISRKQGIEDMQKINKYGGVMLMCFLLINMFVDSNTNRLYAQSQQLELEKEVRTPLQKLPGGGLLIENFETTDPGDLPSGWYNRDFTVEVMSPEERYKYRYQVLDEDGNRYLHYHHTDAHHLNFPLGRRMNLHLSETPILSWKWRVDRLPENALETEDNRNDTAASIYVVFDMGKVAFFKRVPKSIRYTWSSSLPKGYESSLFFGNQKIVVVESGENKLGSWIEFRRNIVEDYRRLFGEEPPVRPLAILLLSDGNSTGSVAEAAYDDLLFLPVDVK